MSPQAPSPHEGWGPEHPDCFSCWQGTDGDKSPKEGFASMVGDPPPQPAPEHKQNPFLASGSPQQVASYLSRSECGLGSPHLEETVELGPGLGSSEAGAGGRG